MHIKDHCKVWSIEKQNIKCTKTAIATFLQQMENITYVKNMNAHELANMVLLYLKLITSYFGDHSNNYQFSSRINYLLSVLEGN